MFFYGFGAVAYGVKDFAFSSFLLLFYNQVIGLPASKVGFVIMLALLLDAFVDPAVGVLSDRTRTRWGRRHPWMYASAVPILVTWLLLWNPPQWSETAMLAWLFVMSVLVRSAVSSYEVPSQALSPELTSDYDERTRVMAYRYLFGWGGGLAMLIASYGYFLAPGPGQDSGLLNRESYIGFAIAGGLSMAVAILLSAAGTHREIARLPDPGPEEHSLGGSLVELAQTLRNGAFAILMLAGLFYFTAQGISFALSNYLYTYVWLFHGADYTWVGVVLFVGAAIAFFVAPRVARRIGKPTAAFAFMLAAAILLASPYALRLIGLFPPPSSPVMLPLLFGIFTINSACGISSTILFASMMADVSEDSEARTGRRSEGVFFAGAFFVQKCTSGIGIFGAGLILSLVGFPEDAVQGAVAEATLDRLTFVFALVYFGLGLVAALLYSRFPFGKAEHQARLARLSAGA
ncbi:MFS transporter [Sphingosinithalassobacter tenebrarum]|uniref:MFS transporter n=1 Tax=Stakelama tenebrarum TaxID=2711215 RepID=A0A6G6YB26_9SPHN|nr:MFS transporter [Sphingosinithalassobacter tenebrarum]